MGASSPAPSGERDRKRSGMARFCGFLRRERIALHCGKENRALGTRTTDFRRVGPGQHTLEREAKCGGAEKAGSGFEHQASSASCNGVPFLRRPTSSCSPAADSKNEDDRCTPESMPKASKLHRRFATFTTL